MERYLGGTCQAQPWFVTGQSGERRKGNNGLGGLPKASKARGSKNFLSHKIEWALRTLKVFEEGGITVRA